MAEEKTVEKPPDEIDPRLAKALEGLNPAETLAMRALMRGGSITAAAAAAGVSRKTIYQWLAEGKPLAAALYIWKTDLAGTSRTRLLMIAELATSSVSQALREGNARLAFRLLEGLGILAPPAMEFPTVEVTHRREIARTKIAESKAKKCRMPEPAIPDEME